MVRIKERQKQWLNRKVGGFQNAPPNCPYGKRPRPLVAQDQTREEDVLYATFPNALTAVVYTSKM
jgi:hypothetical protein